MNLIEMFTNVYYIILPTFHRLEIKIDKFANKVSFMQAYKIGAI